VSGDIAGVQEGGARDMAVDLTGVRGANGLMNGKRVAYMINGMVALWNAGVGVTGKV
jgi:hypothetical protein